MRIADIPDSVLNMGAPDFVATDIASAKVACAMPNGIGVICSEAALAILLSKIEHELRPVREEWLLTTR